MHFSPLLYLSFCSGRHFVNVVASRGQSHTDELSSVRGLRRSDTAANQATLWNQECQKLNGQSESSF